MRTNHANGIARLPFLTDCEGDNGRSVASEVVLSPGVKSRCPRISLLEHVDQSGGLRFDCSMFVGGKGSCMFEH